MSRAGRMRQRVIIQKPSQSRGSTGHVKKTWSKADEASADIEPLRGQEFLEAQAISAEITHRIRIRVGHDITRQMRLVDKHDSSRVFNIIQVLNVKERNEMLEMLCKETVDGPGS